MPTNPTDPAMPDLITSDMVTGVVPLSTAQTAALPRTIAAASRLVRNYCGRYFSRRVIDALLTPAQRGPIILPDYPINDVVRVSVDPRPVLTIVNADPATNQRATARTTRTGDPDAGFSGTGIQLDRYASGVKVTDTITFASLGQPTLAALAAAIAAKGGGWRASVESGFELWGVAELWSGQGAQGALGGSGAQFLAWTTDADFRRSDEAGLLWVSTGTADNDPFRSTRWGPQLDIEYGDDEIRGTLQGVRVTWDAGYDTVPEDLADATIEVAKAMLERKTTSSTIARERIDEWDVQTREVIRGLPYSALETLALYRDHAR